MIAELAAMVASAPTLISEVMIVEGSEECCGEGSAEACGVGCCEEAAPLAMEVVALSEAVEASGSTELEGRMQRIEDRLARIEAMLIRLEGQL